MHLPANLPSLIRQTGLRVVVVGDDWRSNERPGTFLPTGVLNHHTGASAKGWSLAKELSYARWMFRVGRSDLNPPLVQIALGRSGVVYIGSGGRANHAGTAKASGSVSAGDGNRLYIGIEWMLSGTEAIPAGMRKAGTTLNAVLTEKVLNTSVNTISCHYQTSVTGKWDIGDPAGIAFKGHRVLDVPKFRTAVAAERKRLYTTKPPTPSKHHDIIMGQCSMQFSDNPKQWEHDLEILFSRRRRWYTGTETGEADNWAVVQRVAKKYGYTVKRFKANWVAIKNTVIKPRSIKVGTKIVAKAAQVAGPGHDLSYIWVSYYDTILKRRVAVFSTHYPLRGDPHAKDPARRVNLKWTRAVGLSMSEEMTRQAKGYNLAFAGADGNIDVRYSDPFFGGPVTTCWNELKKYPGTVGNRTIDWFASHNADTAVTCLNAVALDDNALFLHMDHDYVEVTYRVKDL